MNEIVKWTVKIMAIKIESQITILMIVTYKVQKQGNSNDHHNDYFDNKDNNNNKMNKK